IFNEKRALVVKSSIMVVSVGGRSAGISVDSRLLCKTNILANEIAIVYPAEHQYNQPVRSLVGSGTSKYEDSESEMQTSIRNGALWIQKAVKSFAPDKNTVTLADKTTLTYEYLVVAAGVEIDWDSIKGLKDALGSEQVCSNYS